MRSRPRFALDFSTEVDPENATFGWKVVGLTYLAVLLPALGVFFPRGVAVRWDWLWVALGGAALTLVINAVLLRRMIATKGYEPPPPWLVLGEVMVGSMAAATLDYALSGPLGIYRPLIFVPTILVAMIGTPLMTGVSWATAVVSMTVSAHAQGVDSEVLLSLAIGNGALWGMVAVMVQVLAATSLRVDHQIMGLVDAATVAARSVTLDEGLDQMVRIIDEWADARATAAFRCREDEPVLVAQWPRSGPQVDPPSPQELAAARVDNGVLVADPRRILTATSVDGEHLAIVIEGTARSRFELLANRYELERMAGQIELLMNASRYIEHLESLGLTDSLTGLPNRRALSERLEAEIQVAQRRESPLVVGMLDFDDFKAFNDTRGHVAGDGLLRSFADVLRSRLRVVDFVARYGGEEFCVVLPATSVEDAMAVLEDVRKGWGADERSGGETFSAGIARWRLGEPADAFIGRADLALYAAKADGKNRTKA